MWRKHLSVVISIFALILTAQLTFAADHKVLELREEVDLADFEDDKTFWEVMQMEKQGIKALLDKEQKTQFELPSVKANITSSRGRDGKKYYNADFDIKTSDGKEYKASEYFTQKVRNGVARPLRNSERKFDEMMARLHKTQDKEKFTTVTLKKALLADRGVGRPWGPIVFLTLVSGGGLTVHLDERNWFYNAGYEPHEVDSGRSFAVGPTHVANDASYGEYLRDLQLFLEKTSNPLPFYENIFAILLESDASGLSAKEGGEFVLNIWGQTLLADYVAVYTAELYRHIMKGLRRASRFENDLTELTLIAPWNIKTKMVPIKGDDGKYRLEKKEKDTLRAWWGSSDEGSGIGGRQRGYRHTFQRELCKAIAKGKPELVDRLKAITGNKRSSVCFQGLMDYLNSNRDVYEDGRRRKGKDKAQNRQDDILENASEIKKLVVEMVQYTIEKSDDIEKELRERY